MLRHIATALVSLTLLVATLSAAGPQWPVSSHRPSPQRYDPLPGTYLSNAGTTCVVYARGDKYEFINDKGSRALYAFVSPNQLRMISGDWDPSVVVTAGIHSTGRIVLQFDSPNAPTGYWIQR